MKPIIYWIAGPWPGRLAIVPRPRGGDWLEDELAAWRGQGIDVVVSTLEPDEEKALDLSKEGDAAGARGLDFIGFPITDRGVPASARSFGDFVKRLDALLRAGKNVALHCRQGIGRSAVVAAGVLMQAGQTPAQALAAVSEARGLQVPETAEQRQWLEGYARTRESVTID
jgi:protein tyrosine phosphatase (PTP) superfamily phosphohydrolase (DUF442 family)